MLLSWNKAAKSWKCENARKKVVAFDVWNKGRSDNQIDKCSSKNNMYAWLVHFSLSGSQKGSISLSPKITAQNVTPRLSCWQRTRVEITAPVGLHPSGSSSVTLVLSVNRTCWKFVFKYFFAQTIRFPLRGDWKWVLWSLSFNQRYYILSFCASDQCQVLQNWRCWCHLVTYWPCLRIFAY